MIGEFIPLDDAHQDPVPERAEAPKMNKAMRDPAQVMTALGLTIDATDQEIEAAARDLDPEAPQDAVEAIRVVIEAVRAAGHSQD